MSATTEPEARAAGPRAAGSRADGPRADGARTLTGWGNVGVPGVELRSEDLERVTRGAPLTRGLGRSYGDASLPASGDAHVAGSALADRILAFDPTSGVLRAEAGFTLVDMNRVFLRRGWFTPVSPGTKFVTLGGMVASDVHGKNHHLRGTFGEHVRALRIGLADGRVVECTPTRHPDLFRATIGGMGLTGHILEVECVLERIPSPWIMMESRRVGSLADFVSGLEDAGRVSPYTMGWVDCVSRGRAMGRGILMTGRWAEPSEAPPDPPTELRNLAVPTMLPSWTVNRYTARAFNEVYFRSHPRHPRRRIVHPDRFFYPLDAIHAWNRVYGRRGFTQYQCVLPASRDTAASRGSRQDGLRASGHEAGPSAHEGVHAFMEVLTRSGAASPLCVIKNCGEEGTGLLSFPRRGISIAADFAITDRTQALVDALNDIVIRYGGRIYLTKDTFTRAEHFRAMEPRLAAFEAVRRKWDPEGRLRSRQSVRLLGDRP